jgi:ankyrin repeat protein
MFLLESGQGFDVDAVGSMGRSMIHWCVGEPESVELILPYKPRLDVLDANGASPLLLAIAHVEPRSARMLLDAGCDIKLVGSCCFPYELTLFCLPSKTVARE